MKKRLLVLYSPLGGGHRSAARAISEAAAARGHTVAEVNLFDHAPKWVADAYLRAHLGGQSLLPLVFGGMYFATNRVGGGLEPARHTLEREVFGRIKHVITDFRPDAIVSTHHLPLVVLAPERQSGALRVPLVNVVTDYIAHAFWAEPGVDLHCVPSMRVANDLVRHGVPRESIALTGIPVREAFEAIPEVSPSNLRPLNVLMTSGGFGVGPLRRMVRSFEGIANVRLTVICGTNDRLRKGIAKDLERYKISGVAVGFENNMPKRIGESDLLVGKAGGLTVSEAMTAGRPMVLVGTVPGNESINEAFVVRGSAGISAKAHEVGAAVSSLRVLVPGMSRSAKQLVQHHAAENVLAHAIRLAKRVGNRPSHPRLFAGKKAA